VDPKISVPWPISIYDVVTATYIYGGVESYFSWVVNGSTVGVFEATN
jgi:hypothetical protein